MEMSLFVYAFLIYAHFLGIATRAQKGLDVFIPHQRHTCQQLTVASGNTVEGKVAVLMKQSGEI
jgi:hypothetical protein